MTDKELVLTVYSDASCALNAGLYQICVPRVGTLLAYNAISSNYETEDDAWHFAALRVRIDQRARGQLQQNRGLVLQKYPKAVCTPLKGSYYQIRRPRMGSDKPATLRYVTLSGRYSNEGFAWEDAASTLNALLIDEMGSRSITRGVSTDADDAAFQQTPREYGFVHQDHIARVTILGERDGTKPKS
jgi:hypothetical protein